MPQTSMIQDFIFYFEEIFTIVTTLPKRQQVNNTYITVMVKMLDNTREQRKDNTTVAGNNV